MPDNYNREKTATFIKVALRDLCGFNYPSHTKVLDFGCGTGQLVGALLRLGFDAYGSDVKARWSKDQSVPLERISTIPLTPYRLPFDENTFDVVVSMSVFEHAQNKAECFQEIYRVLRPGGYSLHIYPGKWYLPSEPHIRVPLVNYFWPKCPKWWLGLWALLGVRKESQRNESWRTVYESNRKYCKDGLSYWSSRQYHKLSLMIFGNCSWPMEFYICNNNTGGYAGFFRKLPFKKFFGFLLREFRTGLMMQKKVK